MSPKLKKIPGQVLIPLLIASVAGAAFLLPGLLPLPPRSVSFSQSATDLDAYDFVELTAKVAAPHASNPFMDAAIHGTFEMARGNKRWQMDGFCDAEDGSVYRLRFMPSAAGDYTYSVEYRQGWSTKTA